MVAFTSSSSTTTGGTTFLLPLWMLFVVYAPRAATAQCTLNVASTSLPAGVTIAGDTITCDGPATLSCAGIIQGCDNVICEGANACVGTRILGAKNVECNANLSCQAASIQQMQDGGKVTCESLSCPSAEIGTHDDSDKFDVLCNGSQACSDAEITTTGVVVCETGSSGDSNEACGGGVEIEAACLICNGDDSCDPDDIASCRFTPLAAGGTTSNDDSATACPADGEATCNDIEQICLPAMQEQDISNCHLLDSLDDNTLMLKDRLFAISSQNQDTRTHLSLIKTNLKKKDEVAASLQKNVDELKVALKNIRKLIGPLVNDMKKTRTSSGVASCKK